MGRGYLALEPEDGGQPVPLDLDEGERVVFDMPPGPVVGRSAFTVSATTDRRLQALSGPLKLVGRGVAYGVPGEPSGELTTDFEIRDLWLGDRVGALTPDRPELVTWTIEDNRRWAVGLESSGAMNLQRLANEFEELADGNFGQFHRIGKFAYVVPTTKSKSGIQFARFDDDEWDAWTAFEALVYMLTRFFDLRQVETAPGARFRPRIVFREPAEKLQNGFPLQNFRMDQPWRVVVERLRKLAHVQFAVNHLGQWEMFRLTPKSLPRRVGGYIGGGNPIPTMRQRTRSRTHRTIFPSRYEFRADYTERIATGATALSSVVDGDDNVLPIQLENVVILPFDTFDPDSGEPILRGTIVTVERALAIWNARASEYYGNVIRGPLTLETVKRRITTPSLARLVSADTRFRPPQNPRGAAIAKTLYDFFRRLYRVPNTIGDNLTKIQAVTAQVKDTRTGRLAPSRVYVDHTLALSFYGARTDRLTGDGGGNGFLSVRPWPVGDPRKRLEDAQPSNYFELKVFNPAQLLFTLRGLGDTESAVSKTYLTTWKVLPPAAVGIEGHPYQIERCPQDDEFRCTFLFSGELVSTNPKNYFVVEKPAIEEPFDGLGPVHEERMRGAFAGYAWNDDTSRTTINPATGQLELEGFDLYNQGRLESIALGLRQQHYFRQRDWLVGNYRAPGFDPEVDKPDGNWGIKVTLQDGFFETVYATYAPKPTPLFESISPDAAELLYRLDEDTLQ